MFIPPPRGDRLADGSLQCAVCGYASKHNSSIKCHIESQHLAHITPGYHCTTCNKFCATKNALKCHRYKHHTMV